MTNWHKLRNSVDYMLKLARDEVMRQQDRIKILEEIERTMENLERSEAVVVQADFANKN